jgi:putative holliday junction resolvase
MKYLGIDFGTKRIGLATNDDTATLAFPYKVIFFGPKVIEEILEIIQKEKIDKIILGESKNKNMQDNPVMKQIREFKKQLEQKDIKVEFHSELFSSAQVISIMGQENKSIDASAAAVILQSYLDLQKNKNHISSR